MGTMQDKMKGKMEETKGKMTGDKTTELKGKARQDAAKAHEKLDNMTGRDKRAL